jgi:hypothetical protein
MAIVMMNRPEEEEPEQKGGHNPENDWIVAEPTHGLLP